MRCLLVSVCTILLLCKLIWPHTSDEIQPVIGHVGSKLAIPANPVRPILLGGVHYFSAQSPSQLLLTRQTYYDPGTLPSSANQCILGNVCI